MYRSINRDTKTILKYSKALKTLISGNTKSEHFKKDGGELYVKGLNIFTNLHW